MLRKLPLGFTGVIVAAMMIAACSSSSISNPNPTGTGPTFQSQTLYATNATQNGISIYPAGTKTGSGPAYQIGGSSTTLAGPQYMTFDSLGDVFATNWVPATGASSILEFKATATGNVFPYQTYTFTTTQPRGIADFMNTFSGSTTPVDALVVTVTNAAQGQQFESQLQFFVAGTLTTPYLTIAGPATGLNVPTGVAVDSKQNFYVANNQGKSVEIFNIPSPTPTPSPTATPSPTPSPTATPTGATPTPTPTPVPTATPSDVPPMATITSGIGKPTGIALDTTGNIYVADQASTTCNCPAILVFPAGSGSGAVPTVISGSNTQLFAPTDVKVDKTGKIYVADSTSSGTSVILIFAAGATGNVAPSLTYTSPGAAIGLGLSP